VARRGGHAQREAIRFDLAADLRKPARDVAAVVDITLRVPVRWALLDEEGKTGDRIHGEG
jgi:hypothetical protein